MINSSMGFTDLHVIIEQTRKHKGLHGPYRMTIFLTGRDYSNDDMIWNMYNSNTESLENNVNV